eukprot:CAMPEP_0114443838 /NCGR_PEP_ID=MMETSP0103-20121206/17747_1 /TAXON_ID=37642 ORGANISM="Paraphysomonas imperforata, Strain PA2" /NCGR_SAMPLE_ID=MMETSP0103 /ASSEMBLY_ACC=CAM_ASM_000201 /LENGTH=438 /DNA_ID=CAMNT_0001615297 /DNA_START=76 /DNA_END=1393 /DNA_ORIENTATION=-
MAEFTDAAVVPPEVTRCNTCKASFSSVEMIRQHYKSDWHVFNSKRRSNGLIRATWSEFKQLPPSERGITKAPVAATRNNRPSSQTSSNTKTPSSATSPPLTGATQTKEINSTDDISDLTSSFTKLAESFGVESKDRIDNIVNLAVEKSQAGGGTGVEGGDDEEDDDNDEDNDDEEEIVIEDNVCIFDDKEFDTVEENLAYMESTFGFFVPEREYLTDLSALIIYLGEKVKLGGICIYCQKQFGPGRSCQSHMQAKSHCKIAYQEGVDLDEFDDFYDFSASYKSIEGGDGNKNDEDGLEKTLEVSAIGELILTDGRCVGHRAFRKYYKQQYKPEESRESVVTARKEELLKLYKSGGFATQTIVDGKVRTQAVATLSDTEVMSLILKQHKEQKKFQLIEQRAQKRQMYANNRREYKSVTDKLRSSATTTAKIRDYHSMLC